MMGFIFVYDNQNHVNPSRFSGLSTPSIRSQVLSHKTFLSSESLTVGRRYAIILSHSDKPMDSVTVQPEAVTILRELLEDSVAHWCEGEFMNGTPVSGETAWKIIECLAVAKQAQFKGEIE